MKTPTSRTLWILFAVIVLVHVVFVALILAGQPPATPLPAASIRAHAARLVRAPAPDHASVVGPARPEFRNAAAQRWDSEPSARFVSLNSQLSALNFAAHGAAIRNPSAGSRASSGPGFSPCYPVKESGARDNALILPADGLIFSASPNV